MESQARKVKEAGRVYSTKETIFWLIFIIRLDSVGSILSCFEVFENFRIFPNKNTKMFFKLAMICVRLRYKNRKPVENSES